MNKDCSKEYSEEKLFKKIAKYGKKFGAKIIYYALILFYVLQEPGVPASIKTTIVTALGYFIFPFDLIPDVMVGPGQVDDMGALMTAIGIAAMFINQNVKDKAIRKMKDIFGDDIEKELVKYDEELDN